jgi:hypothetical protein
MKKACFGLICICWSFFFVLNPIFSLPSYFPCGPEYLFAYLSFNVMILLPGIYFIRVDVFAWNFISPTMLA